MNAHATKDPRITLHKQPGRCGDTDAYNLLPDAAFPPSHLVIHGVVSGRGDVGDGAARVGGQHHLVAHTGLCCNTVLTRGMVETRALHACVDNLGRAHATPNL